MSREERVHAIRIFAGCLEFLPCGCAPGSRTLSRDLSSHGTPVAGRPDRPRHVGCRCGRASRTNARWCADRHQQGQTGDYRDRLHGCDQHCTLSPVPGFVLADRRIASRRSHRRSFFGPTIAAISLGLVGPSAFTRRIGRNETFNHAGNAFGAALAGALAWSWGSAVVFYLISVMALLSVVSVLSIQSNAIDHDRARGLHDGQAKSHAEPSRIGVLLGNRALLIFCLCCVVFHMANAAMLPLVGQKLALQDKNSGTALMSACILLAQGVMIPMAILVGRRADLWGRKPLFLVGFGILSLRGYLYTLSDDRLWLFAVQSLDGVGAGLYGALFPLVVADLTRGTGHFNLAQGAVITAQGIGAAVSTSLAGLVVVHAGYSSAFLVLAAIATVGLLLYLFGMRETRDLDVAGAPDVVTPASRE